jgi:ADP-ribose pyrophosphatase YjhB (NUDIX family)
MYKVFIENRRVIFSMDEAQVAASEKRKDNDFVKDILPLVKSIAEGEELIFPIKNKRQLEAIFKNHQRITAAGGLVQRKQKILFIKRNGYWDIPKGKVELNETITSAAVREVEEECGLKNVQLADFLMTTLHTYQYKDQWVLKETHWYMMRYKGPKKTTPQEEEGIAKVKWFKLGRYQKVINKTYPSIIEVLKCVEGRW